MDASKLFRPEAVAARRDRWLGRPAERTPATRTMLVLLAIATLAVVLLAAPLLPMSTAPTDCANAARAACDGVERESVLGRLGRVAGGRARGTAR
jgi:hypothetical protein